MMHALGGSETNWVYLVTGSELGRSGYTVNALCKNLSVDTWPVDTITKVIIGRTCISLER